MVEKKWIAEYTVVCDTCGAKTLGDTDAQKEIKEAKQAGWKFQPRCFEQDIATCPDCQKESEHQ